MKFERLALLGFSPAELEGPAGHALERELSSRAKLVTVASEPAQVHAADCLVLQLGTPADRALLESLPGLRYVGVYGTDQGRVDLEFAASQGITVSNVPGYSTDSVAEFVVATLLERLRRLEEEKARARNGDLADGPGGTTLRNKPIGVIGFGRIGRRVAEILRNGFGARVAYWSRTRRPELEQALGIVWQELHELSAHSEAVAVHLPRTPSTVGLIDRSVLGKSPPEALFIHLSPMELVDIDALDERLEAGDFGFIFDHADELEPGVVARLARHPRCVAYPPVACNTDAARRAKLCTFLADIDAFLARC